jgi:heme-degrading monooxygenase HmoA
VARYRVKSGMEDRLLELDREFEGRQVPGFIALITYRMDADPNEYYSVAVFENKEVYVANANSPEQDAEYRKWRALLEDDPEWHDGEIVYTYGVT